MPAIKHPRSICKTDGCASAAVAFGLCARHYRWKRDGRSVCARGDCSPVALIGHDLCRGQRLASGPSQ
jgi:hypothetical protein